MNEKTKQEINKFLAEWMGECSAINIKWNGCKECRGWGFYPCPDYFTWPGFGIVWEKARKNNNWIDFKELFD